MSNDQTITSSRKVHEQLDHPIIDADAHFVEYFAALASFFKEEGVDELPQLLGQASIGKLTLEDTSRSDSTQSKSDQSRGVQAPWWAMPAENTLDLATAIIPNLLHERLDDMGIDFSVMYPSVGLILPHIKLEKNRRGACRAMNRYSAEMFGECADRMTPVAVIPLNTPEEGIEALEYAVNELDLKAALIPSYIERQTGSDIWYDTLGLNSEHDYDPFWRRCGELGVSLSSHSISMGIGFRRSPTTYMYNHIGHFAAAGEAFAKSLFFGGVTKRFPELRVAFLEGGVHWAVGLLGDLVSRWEKRNIQAVQAYDPSKVDVALLDQMLDKYGSRLVKRAELGGAKVSTPILGSGGPFDDFEHITPECSEDMADLFLPNFYFGCEADDPMAGTAFDCSRTPFGRPLNAIFSSDIGHWDVPDMTEVLDEAWEQVEHGWLDRAAFRDFTFTNPVRFYTDTNPDFFTGTVVEKAVNAELRRASTTESAQVS